MQLFTPQKFPGVLPGALAKRPPEQHSSLLLSPSSEQRRERLFTNRNFRPVFPGGQDEDPGKDPRMSTGNLIFTQPAVPAKRGLQSG
jgi:hypothetical protein